MIMTSLRYAVHAETEVLLMRITTLVENERLEGREDLEAEHGLSLLIETGEHTILFDTGASGVFADNAERLGIDLKSIDFAVISHHHFDHFGGVARFLEINDTAPIYLREALPAHRFFKALLVLKREIGADLNVLDGVPERFRAISEETEIAPGITLLTKMGTNHLRPKGNKYLFVEHEGAIIEDPFDHELTLVIEEADHLTILTGCSHNGLLNMVDSVIERFPDTPIRSIFGGFHLVGLPFLNTMAASREQVHEMAEYLLDLPVEHVYTGHCTGQRGYETLKEILGDHLQPIPTGSVINI